MVGHDAVGESAAITATVIARLMDEHGCEGKQDGAGFYNYADGARTGLWPGLRTRYTTHLAATCGPRFRPAESLQH